MGSRLGLLVVALSLCGNASAQGIPSLFPPQYRARASRLIDSMDQATAAIRAKRAETWRLQLEAEVEAARSYAIVAASSGGRGPWASTDGSAREGAATAALAASRARARDLARSLASDSGGSSEYLQSRSESARALTALIKASGLDPKASSALGKRLASRVKAGRLFPEVVEVSDALRAAGKAGISEAAALGAAASAEDMAEAALGRKDKISSLAPGAAASLARLELAARAYRSWMASFPDAVYPGDPPASPSSRASVASSLGNMASLGPSRLHALVEAMSEGDGRGASAAHAARNLAALWLSSPENRRKSLAAAYGISESTLAEFCFALDPLEEPTPRQAAPIDPVAALRRLNALVAAAQDGMSGGGSQAEPGLALLESRRLWDIARLEPRYAGLYAEVSSRLASIYTMAAEDATARIETSPSAIAAATRALGEKPERMSARAVDLRCDFGRRIAFEIVVAGPSGRSVSLPVDAALAGKLYAAAFAKAAGIRTPKAGSAALLQKYSQTVASVYDPSEFGDGLGIGEYPPKDAAGGMSPVELALLGGVSP